MRPYILSARAYSLILSTYLSTVHKCFLSSNSRQLRRNSLNKWSLIQKRKDVRTHLSITLRTSQNSCSQQPPGSRVSWFFIIGSKKGEKFWNQDKEFYNRYWKNREIKVSTLFSRVIFTWWKYFRKGISKCDRAL